jgi:predicted small secreted protein
MMKRTRLVVATVALAALATTGTASAATSGSDPKPGAAVKVEGKAKPARDADFAAIAAKLGVTTDRLNAALVAAKRSLAGSTKVTPEAFVAAVATNLGLPASRVKDALEPMLLEPGRPRPGDDKQDCKDRTDKKDGKQVGTDKKVGKHDRKDRKGKKDDKQDCKAMKDGKQVGKDKKGADDPRNSPFTTDAAAARLAAALGVSQAKAKAALVAVVSAPGGIDPTSKAFGDIADSLGVSANRLITALGNLKQSLANV